MIRLPEAWLTDHARRRAAEMGVTTDRVVRIAHDPHLALPDFQGHQTRRLMRSMAEPDLAIVADIVTSAVITVLHWSPEKFRERGAPETETTQ